MKFCRHTLRIGHINSILLFSVFFLTIKTSERPTVLSALCYFCWEIRNFFLFLQACHRFDIATIQFIRHIKIILTFIVKAELVAAATQYVSS